MAKMEDWSDNELENLFLDELNLSYEEGRREAKIMAAVKKKVDWIENNIGNGGVSTFIGQSQTIHIDAFDGNDANDGKTEQRAVKTLDRAYEILKAIKNPQPNLILYGNYVYETPAVAADPANGKDEGLVIFSGCAPHINGREKTPGGGFPTIKFIFCVVGTTPETVNRDSRHYVLGYNCQSQGQRFYMSHINIQDVTIDSNYNGIYFDLCLSTLIRVKFLIPCRFIGGNISASNCTFTGSVITKDSTDYKPWNESFGFALGLWQCTAILGNTNFDVDDGKSICVGVFSGSMCRLGAIKTKAQPSGATQPICKVTLSRLAIAEEPTGAISNFPYGVSLEYDSVLFFSSKLMYDYWTAIGDGISSTGNSVVVAGGVFVKDGVFGTSPSSESSIAIRNGEQAADGGGIWLYGKDYDSLIAGGVRLQASSGVEDFYAIDIKADGGVHIFEGIDSIYSDGEASLGDSGHRFGQLYTTTAPDVSSDERLKQEVKTIPESVLDAWGDVEWLQYKYNDAVEKKGIKARLHVGSIAQRIDRAFKKHGLDASQYGFFCHDEWKAEDEVFNDEGIRIAKARHAGDEYSIRYEEALAMEAAYLRRRIAALEARLNGNN